MLLLASSIVISTSVSNVCYQFLVTELLAIVLDLQVTLQLDFADAHLSLKLLTIIPLVTTLNTTAFLAPFLTVNSLPITVLQFTILLDRSLGWRTSWSTKLQVVLLQNTFVTVAILLVSIIPATALMSTDLHASVILQILVLRNLLPIVAAVSHNSTFGTASTTAYYTTFGSRVRRPHQGALDG